MFAINLSRPLGTPLFGVIALALAGCASGSSLTGADAVAPAASTGEPVYTLADIQAATGADLDGVLGAPALVRKEGEGEFRRYTLAQCSLIVVLYPQTDGRLVVEHIDVAARRSGEARPDVKQCLALG